MDDMDDTPANTTQMDASLPSMPVVILGRIFECMSFFYDGPTSLVSLEMTCRSLKGVLSDDSMWARLIDNGDHRPRYQQPHTDIENWPTWREYALTVRTLQRIRRYQRGVDNLILETLGGADGFRKVADALLQKMNPSLATSPYRLCLRGDSIVYLAEVLQGHMTTRMEKALDCAIFRSGPEAHYPVVRPQDLVFMDKLSARDISKQSCSTASKSHSCGMHSVDGEWAWPHDDCKEESVLGAEARRLLVRKLAYRAGIVRLSGDAFTLFATEILHDMALLLVDAFEASKGAAPTSADAFTKRIQAADPRYVSSDQDRLHCDYFYNFSPPFRTDKSGKIECVIIPRQIKDAALRKGLKPLLGFGEMNCDEWIASDGRTAEEEIDEAMAQYYVDDAEGVNWTKMIIDSMIDESMESGRDCYESDDSTGTLVA